MPRIGDLTAGELAHCAETEFLLHGRTELCAHLVFRALTLQHDQPKALLVLCDFLDQPNLERLAAAVFEHALSSACRLAGEERRRIEDRRHVNQWFWGFSRHESGRTALSYWELQETHRFVLDEPRWQEWLDGFRAQAGSAETAFRASLTFVGVAGGLLTHRQKKDQAVFGDLFEPHQFLPTDGYLRWLDEESTELEQLEEELRTRLGRPSPECGPDPAATGVPAFQPG